MIFMPKTPRPDLQAQLDKEKAKANGNYRIPALITQLEKDCLGKCYLCEDSEATTIQVEHLQPHQGDLALKFDWNNLLWACGHCNGIKQEKFVPLLDCTKDPQVWKQVQLRVIRFPKFTIEVIGNPEQGQEQACQNAVDLLSQCFTGKTPLRQREAANLRRKMLRLDAELSVAICNQDETKLQELTSASAAFAGMQRWTLCLDHPAIWAKIQSLVA